MVGATPVSFPCTLSMPRREASHDFPSLSHTPDPYRACLPVSRCPAPENKHTRKNGREMR